MLAYFRPYYVNGEVFTCKLHNFKIILRNSHLFINNYFISIYIDLHKYLSNDFHFKLHVILISSNFPSPKINLVVNDIQRSCITLKEDMIVKYILSTNKG